MSIAEILMIGVGLSADAFAVAVSKGLGLKNMSWKIAVIVGTYFGFFQGLMPTIGYMAGNSITNVVSKYGGFITFLLLLIVGVNMIREAYRIKDEIENVNIDFKTMLVLAFATSIDACAAGVSLSFYQIDILHAAMVIGISTFLFSIIGVKIGNFCGKRYEKIAQILGGIILVIIGIKSLFFV